LIIASKGRFDRVGRGGVGLERDGQATVPGDEFMEATLDVWEIPAESATRVGHPAPFPVALVERCLHLFTYDGDVVLDPFMGSGTTGVAAKRTGRRFVGYDTEPSYVRQARERIESLAPAGLADRRTVKDMARSLLAECGFETLDDNARIAPGVTVSVRGTRRGGLSQLFEFGGVHTPARPGMSRIETVWKTVAKASILRESSRGESLIVLTSGTVRGGPLATVTGVGKPIAAVIDMTLDDAAERLRTAVAALHDEV
jgi:site-specific DNA-methyltransferase (adenine-specific)